MKTFYKIDINGTLSQGGGTVMPNGFTEYTVGQEPQELLDARFIANNIPNKVQELYAAYEADNQLDIDYMATTFQADKASQDIMGQVLAVGSVPAEFYWLDLTNNKIAMTYAELQGLAGSILTRSQINFDKLQTLKEEVLVATTQEELELIVW